MRTRFTLAGVAAALLTAAAVGGTAVAAGPGLPRTYDVQRIDSPQPKVQVSFGSGMAGAGDVNGDGEDDLLLPQGQHPTEEGQVFVISGETGALITTIAAPDAGNPTGAATNNNTANFGFPWVSKIGRTQSAPPYSDIGSCNGGLNGQLCPLGVIGPADGVPEIVVGARGVDAGGRRDSGRVYVFDGRTRALLKRIDQPVEDATPLALSRAGGSWFGRAALNPAGLPACEGNFGVGDCPTGIPRAVEIGDMDGAGQPDLVIGASANSEDPASAYPGSHCARAIPSTLCQGSGRAYVFRGEEIAGTSPTEILDGTGPGETFKKLRNPFVQGDSLFDERQLGSELFANTLTAVGDVGRCTVAIPAGDRCPAASTTVSPDGKPEVLVGNLRVDYPVDNPDPTLADVGVAHLVDGATGSILQHYLHPEPQAGATFSSFGASHEPPVGDLGGTALPDVYLPATGQHTAATGGGRGYAMNGSFKGASSLMLSRINDPTPSKGEGFSSSAVGVGDLVGGPATPANELLVGASGGGGTPVTNDVHFFNATTERNLQSVVDPDGQPGSGFGSSIVPLGDLNEDSYLDFAVGAERYSGTTGIAQGRIYIFRSNNSAAPAGPTPSSPAPGAPTPAPAAPAAGAIPSVAGCPSSRVARKLISLTSAADSQNGTPGPDTIFAGSGDDLIDALAGDDCVDLGAGDDRGQGGEGNDLVLGGTGGDLLNGGAGKDRLVGGAGKDRIVAGGGTDTISGGAGNDVIDGGSGRDRISCGSGRDTVVATRTDRVARDCERVRRR